MEAKNYWKQNLIFYNYFKILVNTGPKKAFNCIVFYFIFLTVNSNDNFDQDPNQNFNAPITTPILYKKLFLFHKRKFHIAT